MTPAKTRTVSALIPMICGVTAAMLVAAAGLRLPYGYYTFLRLIVSISSGIMAWNLANESKRLLKFLAIMFGLICVLYNPIIVVHLTRPVWAPINILTAICFVIGALIFRPFLTGSRVS